MRIGIMGSGGIGGFLGARLAAAGHDVLFIARGPHLAAMQQNGLTLKDVDQEIHVSDVSATNDPSDEKSVDMILFSVKLYDTVEAAKVCQKMMNEDTFILTLQNGVEAVDLVSDVVGPDRTLGGSIYISAHITAPGEISSKGGDKMLTFGEVSGENTPRTETLSQLISDSGLIPVVTDNMRLLLWQKFVLLAANSGLGALTNLGIRDMCKDQDIRPLFLQAMQEILPIAKAEGIELDQSIVDMMMAKIDSLQGDDLIASQLLDLQKGKKLELEWLQGTIHRLGVKHNIPTPIHSTTYLALRRFADGT